MNLNNADIIIINTCGFIESSKQESINTILEDGKNIKKNHNCKSTYSYRMFNPKIWK